MFLTICLSVLANPKDCSHREYADANQLTHFRARDAPTNRDKFVAGRSERPPDDCALRDRSTMPINDATGVCVWRSRLTTSDDYGRCQACREPLKVHKA